LSKGILDIILNRERGLIVNREYQQDYDEYIPMEEFGDDEVKSLPPRSAKHGIKPQKKSGNILHVLTGSLIFIIIIAISVYFFMSLSDDNEVKDFDVLPSTTTTEESEGNSEQVGNSDSEPVEPDANKDTNEDASENTEEANLPVENSQEGTIHIVKSGENLFRISILYYNSGEYYEELAQYNGLNSAADIYEGMNLKIPNKEVLITNE